MAEGDKSVIRLGTPSAFVMLLGLILVYFALHGWDRKYGTFNGAFAGAGAAGTGGTRARTTTAASTSSPSTSSNPTVRTA